MRFINAVKNVVVRLPADHSEENYNPHLTIGKMKIKPECMLPLYVSF